MTDKNTNAEATPESKEITWVRPSGLKITTKDTPNMVAHAKSQGWKKDGK